MVAVVFWLIVNVVALLIAVTLAPDGIPVPMTSIPTTILVVSFMVMCLTLVVDPSLRPLVWFVSHVASVKVAYPSPSLVS